MSKFPWDVLTDILCRLPVEPLLRFRCLSKRVCSLIDDPEFVKLHFNQSIQSGTNRCLIADDVRPNGLMFSLNLDEQDTRLMELNRPFDCLADVVEVSFSRSGTVEKLRKDFPDVFGCCNGLIALYNPVVGMALWNPSTRKHQMLPNFWGDYNSSDSLLDGFGYDFVMEDYKVIRMVQCHRRNNTRGMIYSVKTDSSRRIEKPPYDFHIDEKRASGVLLGSVLHWVVSHSPHNGENDWILAFDLRDEKFHQLPLPDLEQDFVLSVGVLGGCISASFILGPNDRRVEVWIMKAYGQKDSWAKLCSIPNEDENSFNFCRSYLKPLGYSKFCNKVLVEQDGSFLYWYNLETSCLEYIEISGGFPRRICADIFVRSLASLNFGAGNAQESNKRRRIGGKTTKKKRANIQRIGHCWSV